MRGWLDDPRIPAPPALPKKFVAYHRRWHMTYNAALFLFECAYCGAKPRAMCVTTHAGNPRNAHLVGVMMAWPHKPRREQAWNIATKKCGYMDASGQTKVKL